MLALTSAVHGGIGQSETLFIIAAIAVAAFWKALVKLGLAVLLIVVFSSASATLHLLHTILP